MVYESVRDLYSSYDSFLLDMYGVLYNGCGLYAGALDLLVDMVAAKKEVVILSNASVVSEVAMEKYASLGLEKGKHFSEFITSGEVFWHILKKDFDQATYFQIFLPNKEVFANTGLSESFSIKDADFIYIGTVLIDGAPIDLNNLSDFNNVPLPFDSLFDVEWSKIRELHTIQERLEECLKYNKKLIVTNPDVLAMEKCECGVVPILCQGGVGEYYEKMGGTVIYCGKPYGKIYDYARPFVRGKTVMVGDTPWTDVLGGNMAGFDTILTITGVSGLFISRMPEVCPMSQKIESLLTTVSDRMSHKSLREHNRIPTHIVKQFA